MNSPLSVYMILHGNLGFSSISRDQYATVLDRCYWPMVRLIEAGCPMAIEFPADTLLQLAVLDPLFVSSISKLWLKGKCEILGSGFTQLIMPLVPHKVNRKNVEYGLEVYEKMLGRLPKICFVPEQTFSQALPEILKNQGFEAMVMDWDNAAQHHSHPLETRYRPALLKAGENQTLPVVWNSSMQSYKFQRYVYGRISLSDYVAGLSEHAKGDSPRALCLYGTDWEIFNYRPVTQEEASGEIERVHQVFEALKKSGQFRFTLPSQILRDIPPTQTIDIASSEIPIPCKNRVDYNVVRWAVSGRDDSQHNARCFDLFQKLEHLEALEKSAPGKKADLKDSWLQLIRLWGSDYRTKTTDEKYYEFWASMGHSSTAVDGKTFQILSKTKLEKDLWVHNHTPFDWDNEVVEAPLCFQPGRFRDLIGLKLNGEKVQSQCENVEYYPDRSLRRLLLVFCVSRLKSGESQVGSFYPLSSLDHAHYTLRLNGPEIAVTTPHVSLQLNTLTGGDIRSLVFSKLSPNPLLKYLPPVYFDNIAYSNDYYSGWSQLCTEDGLVVNDTLPTKFKPDPNYYTVRVPLHFQSSFLDGTIRKRYDVYLHQNRVDLTLRFFFPNLLPMFLRTGILTLNPETFQKNSLRYSTTNGGTQIESFALNGKTVGHARPAGQLCSSTSCLGATEGWIAAHDDALGLAVLTQKSQWYSAPMIEYEEIGERWLCRMIHSLCESDDTGRIHLRGHNEIRLSLVGFSDSQLGDIRKLAHHKNHPLTLLQNPHG